MSTKAPKEDPERGIPRGLFQPRQGGGKTAKLLCDSPFWRTKFLQRLLETEGSVREAAISAGIPPIVAYQARRRDDDFRQDWEEIQQLVREKRADEIEATLHTSCVEGEKTCRYDRDGNLLEEAFEKDTKAGQFLLEAYQPAMFRNLKQEKAKSDIESVADLFRALAEERRASAQLAQTTSAAIDAEVIPSGPPPLVPGKAN